MAETTTDTMPLVHEELRERLRSMIGDTWKAGDKLPPIKELAQNLNAGHVNTHRAVKQLVGEGLLLSRPRRGTVVNPKLEARAKARQKLQGTHIGLVTGVNRHELFLRPAMEKLEGQLESLGADCTDENYGSLHPNHELDLQTYSDYDALVLINPPTRLPLHARPGQPLLVVTTCQDQLLPMASGYDIVSVDSEQGGFLAGQHCREIGLEYVAFIGCRADQDIRQSETSNNLDLTCQLRLRGFRQGFGQPFDRVRIHVASDYHSDQGAKAVPWFLELDRRPQGVFCASDDLAIGFAHGALAHGLTPGKDVQLIGFDGQTRGRDLLSGGLTTIDVPAAKMGKVAADLLRRRLQNAQAPVRRIYLACSHFQGATTRMRG